MTSWLRLAILGLILTAAAFAQVHTASVHGTVSDQSGNPLSGAVVQITNPDNLQVRSYVTQSDGAYQFHQLYDNVTYNLRAQYRGTFSSTKSISKFRSSDDSVVNLTVPVKK
jgi:hypothetical protein